MMICRIIITALLFVFFFIIFTLAVALVGCETETPEERLSECVDACAGAHGVGDDSEYLDCVGVCIDEYEEAQ